MDKTLNKLLKIGLIVVIAYFVIGLIWLAGFSYVIYMSTGFNQPESITEQQVTTAEINWGCNDVGYFIDCKRECFDKIEPGGWTTFNESHLTGAYICSEMCKEISELKCKY